MKVIVNGVWRELGQGSGPQQDCAAQPTLAHVLTELGLADRIVATAVNGEFVAIGARAGTPVHEGDRVEILAPMQGG